MANIEFPPAIMGRNALSVPIRRLCPPASTAALSGSHLSLTHSSLLARQSSTLYNVGSSGRIGAAAPGFTPSGVLPMDCDTIRRTSRGQHPWQTRPGAVLVFGPLPP